MTLRQLVATLLTLRRGAGRRPVAARSYRPRVEALETRALLSGLAVATDSYSTDRILVRMVEGAAAAADTALASAGLSWGEAFALVPGLREVRLQAGVSVQSALQTLRGLSTVAYAEPDYRVTIDAVPNDGSFGSLWGLNSTGQIGGTADADIDAPEAWDIHRGSGNFVVGVIDTGVDYRHPDLAANIWVNAREVAGNGRDDDGNGYVDDVYGYDFANNDADPMDDNGHGTHVAGTIGAVGNNGVGVAGVNWNVKIAALKFLNASGSGYTSNAVRALDYAVRMGIKITNNSWGGGGASTALSNAIQRAQAAGHIFVAAAGNDASNNDAVGSFPANYAFDNVVSVAATDRNDRLASFSNYGATTVDLAAPGVSILSTTPNNAYATYSGTSMATPHVAGAMALVWDANPNWTYSQVIQRVLTTVDTVSALSGKVATGGRLNVARALAGATPPADVTGPRVVAAAPSATGVNPVSSVRLTFSETIAAGTFTAADVVSFTNSAGTDLRGTISSVTGSGTTWTVNFAAQSAASTYTLVVGPDIRDLAGNLMDQNSNGVRGETADRYTTAFQIQAPTSGAPLTITNATSLAIPDRSTVTSSLTVASTATLADLNVVVNLRHTYAGDLILRLVGPDGTTVTLVNRRGGSGDNFTNTTFDTEAAASIVGAAAPFTGSFRPEGSLSAFRGKSLTGTWRLQITDAAWFDTGTLLSWSLVATPVATTTAATNPPNPRGVDAFFGLLGSLGYGPTNSSQRRR